VYDRATKAADGVGEINGVGVAEIVFGEDGFLCVGVGGEDVAALDAREQSAVDRRREETTVFLNENVVDGAFGDFAALIQEEDVVVTGGDCGLEGLGVQRAVGGFVEVHGIFGIGALSGNADAEGFGGRGGDGLGGDLEGAVVVEEETDFLRQMRRVSPRFAGMASQRVGVSL
jgi:hypothetical protein